MKITSTYDEVHYISLTNAAPTTINFDEPTAGQTEELTTEAYALMGTGFTEINEAPNAETEETGYVNMKSMSTTVKSYNNKFSGSSDKIVDERAVMSLYDVAYYQKTGEEAERNLFNIDYTQPLDEAGKLYKARMFRVSVAISTINKAATEKVSFEFELGAVKDVVHGTFAKDTKTFTVVDTENYTPAQPSQVNMEL